VSVGRFAPSPTGPLHVGNLRTALVAWLAARSTGSAFLLRSEDLDPGARREHEAGQQADLAAVGVDWDGPVVRQSDRRARYEDALAALVDQGLTYPCYCTRREILDAPRAPHDDQPEGAYPGTCRTLTAGERAARERDGRPPALRLRAGGVRVEVVDALHGPIAGVVDDLVLRRNDGLPAYNLAVVVDDAAQDVEEVVRGDDLLSSTPRQAHLARLLGLPVPAYLHVPLVVGADGARLAKRHGARTLADLAAEGVAPRRLRAVLLRSLGLAHDGEDPGDDELFRRFSPAVLPREPWAFDPATLAGAET
jgi:glutamyl-tRNA synthetase